MLPSVTKTLIMEPMTRSLFILSIATAACASASGGSRKGACALVSGDSIYLKRGTVYRDCAVDQRASLVDRSAHPDFRPTSLPPGGRACYSAEVEFVVDTTGVPEAEPVTVLRSTNREFAQAVVAVVPRWRYQPATIQGVPVRQIVREREAIAQEVVAVPAGQMPRPGRPPSC